MRTSPSAPRGLRIFPHLAQSIILIDVRTVLEHVKLVRIPSPSLSKHSFLKLPGEDVLGMS